ncbi:MAG: hypothetical protein U0893_17840 [Chloroflexota bacterium]
MIVDETGALWLNPWVAMLLIAGFVGLVLWCHRWLETGAAPMPRSAAVRTRSKVIRSRATRQQHAGLSVVPLTRVGRHGLQVARSNGAPRSAA